LFVLLVDFFPYFSPWPGLFPSAQLKGHDEGHAPQSKKLYDIISPTAVTGLLKSTLENKPERKKRKKDVEDCTAKTIFECLELIPGPHGIAYFSTHALGT